MKKQILARISQISQNYICNWITYKKLYRNGHYAIGEKGLLHLEDKVSKYIPEAEFSHGGEMTIHQLLTHTSGLAENPLFIPFKDKPLSSAPGTKYEYSNSGYLLLEEIIEKVSGKPFVVYLKENIFDPLNMKNTGYSDTMKNVDGAATGYIKEEDTIKEFYEPENLHLGGAGGLYSTVDDLLKWDKALDTEKLVSKDSIDKIFTPDPVTAESLEQQLGLKDRGVGYGWIVAKDKSSARNFGLIGALHLL